MDITSDRVFLLEFLTSLHLFFFKYASRYIYRIFSTKISSLHSLNLAQIKWKITSLKRFQIKIVSSLHALWKKWGFTLHVINGSKKYDLYLLIVSLRFQVERCNGLILYFKRN